MINVQTASPSKIDSPDTAFVDQTMLVPQTTFSSQRVLVPLTMFYP
jgi:hypothetical protein